MKKIVLYALVFVFFGCVEFKIHSDTQYIYPQETDNLQIPSTKEVSSLISDYSVGRFEKIKNETFFIPLNFDYHVTTVGKYRVPIGDLIITEDVNKYKPIRFLSEDNDYRNDSDGNAFLFFLPSTNPSAISIQKLSLQFPNADYIDNNSVISGGTVFHYSYDVNRKGFEVFHSKKFPAFNDDITELEILYESIDILRMAKNLRDTTLTEFNWNKLKHVAPIHFSRYFDEALLDTLSEITKSQPKNFQYKYEPLKLEFELSTVKDSSLAIFKNDLTKTPLKQDYDIDNNIYSKESIRILKNYFGFNSYYINIKKREGNTFYFDNGFDKLVLYFIPEKDLLFTIQDNDSFNVYNDEIYYHYFKEHLISRLEK